ncbi:MAG: hypothetical protein JO081_14370 [Alphaproteobacteria bacterium]|nr:hypothetical protein [Alphaproteobacteria bacterium]
MHKLLPLLALIVTASISVGRPAVAESRFTGPLPSPSATDVAGLHATVMLVGGMGGGTGGGMGGMTGGGMGGMTGGGMGGMTGGGMGGTNSYSNVPGGGGDPYGRSETTGAGLQPPQYYHCITQQGQCSVSSAVGALRSGASCTCLFGGKGKIK